MAQGRSSLANAHRAHGRSSVGGTVSPHHPKASTDGVPKRLSCTNASTVRSAGLNNCHQGSTPSSGVSPPHQSSVASGRPDSRIVSSFLVGLRKAIYREARDILNRTRGKVHCRWTLKDVADAVCRATKVTMRCYHIVEQWKEAVRESTTRREEEARATSPQVSTCAARVAEASATSNEDTEASPAAMLEACLGEVFNQLQSSGAEDLCNVNSVGVVKLCRDIGRALSHLANMCMSDLQGVEGVGSLLESHASHVATMVGNLKSEMYRMQAALKAAEEARQQAEADAVARAQAAKAQARAEAERAASRKEKRRAHQQRVHEQRMSACSPDADASTDANKFALTQVGTMINQLGELEKTLMTNPASIAHVGALASFFTRDTAPPPPQLTRPPSSQSSCLEEADRGQKQEQSDASGPTRGLWAATEVTTSAPHLRPGSSCREAEQHYRQAPMTPKEDSSALSMSGDSDQMPYVAPATFPEGEEGKVESCIGFTQQKDADGSKLVAKGTQSKVRDGTTADISVAKIATPARTAEPSGAPRTSLEGPRTGLSSQQVYKHANRVLEKPAFARSSVSPEDASIDVKTSDQLEKSDKDEPPALVTSSDTQRTSDSSAPSANPTAQPNPANRFAAIGWHKVKVAASAIAEQSKRQAGVDKLQCHPVGRQALEGHLHTQAESPSQLFRRLSAGNGDTDASSLDCSHYQQLATAKPALALSLEKEVSARGLVSPECGKSASSGQPVLFMRDQGDASQETRISTPDGELPVVRRIRTPMSAREKHVCRHENPITERQSRSVNAHLDPALAAVAQRRSSQQTEAQPVMQKRVRFHASVIPPKPSSALSALSDRQRLPPLTGAADELSPSQTVPPVLTAQKNMSSSPMTAWANFMASGSNYL